MGAAAFRRLCPVAALEPVDVDQVLAHRRYIARLLVAFVPLIMIVKDHRDDIVKIDDEAVARSVVDQAMEPLVEFREVGKSAFPLMEQEQMLLLDALERSPRRIVGREDDEPSRGAQFEHLPHLEQFLGELVGEPLERPASALPPFQKSELAEAVEIVADRRSRDAELARQFEPVDLLAGLAVAVQDPLHEALFDNGAELLGLQVRVEVGWNRAPQKHLAPSVMSQDSLRRERRHDGADGGSADPKRLRPVRLGSDVGTDRIGAKAREPLIAGALEDGVGLHLPAPSVWACF